MLNNQKGSLAVTLVFIMLLLAMALALSSRAIFNVQSTTAVENDTRAFYLAEAGIERFISALHDDEDDINVSELNNFADFEEGSFELEITDADGNYINQIEKNDFISDIDNYTITSRGEIRDISSEVIVGLGLTSSGSGTIASPNFNPDWDGGRHGDDITSVPEDIHNESDDIPGTPGELEDISYLEEILEDEYPAEHNRPDIYEFDSGRTPSDAADDNRVLDLTEIHDSRYFYAGDDGFYLDDVSRIIGDPDEPSIIITRHNFVAEHDIHLENVYIFSTAGDQINFGGDVTARNALIHSQSNIQIEGNHFDYEGYIVAPQSNIEFGLTDGENSNFRTPESLDLPDYLEIFHEGDVEEYVDELTSHDGDDDRDDLSYGIVSYQVN